MGGKALILDAWKRLCKSDPGAPAVIDGESGERTSRRALDQRSNALATELAAAGIERGDLVAIQLPNSVDFLAATLAVRACQAVAVPVDRDATQTEVATELKHFGARGLGYPTDWRSRRATTRAASTGKETTP